MTGRSSCRRRQCGFTLVEVLVALLVFSLGVLGMVAMQAKATVRAVDAEDRTRAALLADDLIATMWAERSAAVSAAALAAWESRLNNAQAGGLPGSPAYTIQTVDGLTTITLTWNEPTRRVNGTALASRYATSVVIP